MKITQTPSPNHDARTLPVSLLVLHYTGMETGQAALERMCAGAAKVSAHYMVAEDGHISQLVDESRRAWHAGLSEWAGESNINSASIGIEIVNGGHDYGLPDFPDVQIEALMSLCRDIQTRHNISLFGLVAHSDIAPERKQDPGEKFPWQKLAAHGIGYWPDLKLSAKTQTLFEKGARDRGVAIVQSGLAYLGYAVEVTGVLDAKTQCILCAFQRRYRPARIDGQIDVHTMEILTDLANAKKTARTA
ncbi:MAG: N-acetylmuramoyl-L-alanine amidase [Robiginitomaculum sp.]|nr:MAG: N-acetylmuramoyl-L-alanine amidase [Robiginitomaculum sp.]